MRSIALLVGVAAAAGCHQPLVRLDEREFESLQSLEQSPLLIELPAEPPERELHANGALRIADQEEFNLSFRSTPLRVAIEEIASRADVTMISDASISGEVDLTFTDITLDDALYTLLTQHNLVLLPGPGNVYFVERGDDPSQVTEFIQLVNVRAADVASNLEALVGAGSRVIADNDRNLVCLIGRQSDVAAVRRYLRHVDTLKEQVLLEVHIFEVLYEDGFELGAAASYDTTIDGNALDILSNFGGVGGFTTSFARSSGSLDATIDAMRSFVGIELISSPRVLAVTNTLAVVDVVKELPYVQVTATTTGTTAGVGSTVQEEVEFKEAGIKLQITPSIQEAGHLQIQIRQEIIEEVDRFKDIPVVDRRTLDTQFIVKDQETIVLGGLIQSRHSESRTGVPILMHIPVLGQLFRRDDDLQRKQEILLFVTPRILSPGQASQLTPHYKSAYRETRRDLEFPTTSTTPLLGTRVDAVEDSSD